MEKNTKRISVPSRIRHKGVFTLFSGTSAWDETEVERDTIDESMLKSWLYECVLHHTGKVVTDNEWNLFKANKRLIRKCGNLRHSFEYSPFTIET